MVTSDDFQAWKNRRQILAFLFGVERSSHSKFITSEKGQLTLLALEKLYDRLLPVSCNWLLLVTLALSGFIW